MQGAVHSGNGNSNARACVFATFPMPQHKERSRQLILNKTLQCCNGLLVCFLSIRGSVFHYKTRKRAKDVR